MEPVEAEAASAQKQRLKESCICSFNWIRWVHTQLLLILVLSTQAVLGGQIVKYLPGFDGELPFKLETGYISVGDSELFYYFIESEGNPQEDPLFLWLTGGPGCTAFSGLIYEVGPMEYDIENYSGGLPKLRYYPYARTKTASMIFLDAPVGTGFSYSRTKEGWSTSDTKSSEQSYQFLRKWLVEHPQFLSVQLYIGGDSYAGLTVPLITKKIIDGNDHKAEPYMNIKGYLAGSPLTDRLDDENSKIEYANRMALISDEIYENAKRSCHENYVNVDPANTACLEVLGDVQKCLKDLSDKDFLKPKCDLSSSDHELYPDRRSLEEDATGFLLEPSMNRKPYCTNYKLTHNNIWANDDSVQEALHVRKGTVPKWERCNNSLSYTEDVSNVVPVHKELSRSALEVLVESGDHDISVPYVGTLKWIKSLNLTLVDKWRPWFVDDQVAGYTTKYSEEEGYHLTFATVKGAGHPAPEYCRKECYHLFDRWVHYRPV
ncbi:serine carboxypeptidase-like 18 [Actinidia eriantha]|uniref:serine carboxypeptidase-like 18 n=1 Tax=Actinidia eriantha TaxID=165200 RepID=UPI00258D0AB8|nr:serine carboxypeptidase-like 18 [Actinidia eriantha]